MTAAHNSSAWVLAIPFATIGAAALITGGVMLIRRVQAIWRGTTVDAEVDQREAHMVPVAEGRAPGASGSTVTPTFRYRAADGEVRTARLDHQARQRLRSEGYRVRYPIGAQVRVRIDPERPDVAYEDKVVSLIVFPGLLVFAGLLMTLLALGIYFG